MTPFHGSTDKFLIELKKSTQRKKRTLWDQWFHREVPSNHPAHKTTGNFSSYT